MRNWKFDHIDFSTFPYYNGDDLGVFFTPEKIIAKIWAPTATQIEFRVYEHHLVGDPIRIDNMEPAIKGCWALELHGNFEGLFYAFRVNDGQGWLNETPGPEARAVGANGRRGLVFDPQETNPLNWETDQCIELENPVDAVIYELHVRDFSISPSSGMANKGKFLAFTESGTKSPAGLSTGTDHLAELGITHVHLLPIADFFSVDELYPDEKYNWGYDPQNYNAPDGSYATNPNNTSRIREFKMLVQALHKKGIGVVMDVVYNHTGFTRRSWFNQTVPGYYYRQNSDGSFSNASGCGNELASERAMVRKYMIDSLVYWASEYHIDGFRFDLMGIHDIETMNRIRLALDKVRPGILLYGEGWTADQSPLDEKHRAVKHHVTHLDRIAVFNDDLRDAIKGDNFDAKSKGFVSGKTLREETIKFGIVGACHHPQIIYSYVESSHFAWAAEPSQCVNYASCHDNYTLFDKLTLSSPDASANEIVKMQMLAGAIVLTAQGIPFLHAGAEFCRSKFGEHNSYRSPDTVNQIDWLAKEKFLNVFDYYRKLVQLRLNHPAFRMRRGEEIRQHLKFCTHYQPGVFAYSIDGFQKEEKWETILVIFNGNRKPVSFPMDPLHTWTIIARGEQINEEGICQHTDIHVLVPEISMMVLVRQ